MILKEVQEDSGIQGCDMNGRIIQMFSRFEMLNRSKPKFLYVGQKEYNELLQGTNTLNLEEKRLFYFGIELVEVFRPSFLAVGS